jgi:hypothetical protein
MIVWRAHLAPALGIKIIGNPVIAAPVIIVFFMKPLLVILSMTTPEVSAENTSIHPMRLTCLAYEK